jgi:hypothetical protein
MQRRKERRIPLLRRRQEEGEKDSTTEQEAGGRRGGFHSPCRSKGNERRNPQLRNVVLTAGRKSA